MAISWSRARVLCNKSEQDLLGWTQLRRLRTLTADRLKAKLDRARKLRDKFTDLSREQSREARGRAAPRSSRPAKSNAATIEKKQMFAAAVELFQDRLSSVEAAGNGAGTTKTVTTKPGAKKAGKKKAAKTTTKAATADESEKKTAKKVGKKKVAKKKTAKKAARKKAAAATEGKKASKKKEGKKKVAKKKATKKKATKKKATKKKATKKKAATEKATKKKAAKKPMTRKEAAKDKLAKRRANKKKANKKKTAQAKAAEAEASAASDGEAEAPADKKVRRSAAATLKAGIAKRRLKRTRKDDLAEERRKSRAMQVKHDRNQRAHTASAGRRKQARRDSR